jgi:glycosyltransferase involved in cell wall biosynthesis
MKNYDYLFIDAISISSNGGGATHLIEILKNTNLEKYKFKKIYIFGAKLLLNKIPNYDFLIKKTSPLLDNNIFFRYCYILFYIPFFYFKIKPKVIFSLASNLHLFGKLITINQSLLPFENNLINYKYKSILYFKFIKFFNVLAYRKSLGIIFMTNYGKNLVCKNSINLLNKSVIIPHGLPVLIKDFPHKINFNLSNEVSILYVSSINEYKNHLNVYNAIKCLIILGYKIKLEFIGESGIYGKIVIDFINSQDNENLTFIYHDHMDLNLLYKKYPTVDIFVFASSAESFGINILEAMNFALPIACSNLSSMAETIKDACEYFNPYDINSIKNSLIKIISNNDFRKDIAFKAQKYANEYNWKKCSRATLSYINSFY